MKILQFDAENVKKLSVVSITPKGALVELVGPNGSGKTSVLDAIWWVLEGKKAVQSKPIRAGQERAFASLAIGDKEVKFRITRRFRQVDGTEYTTDLIVETGEGYKVKSGQDVLDSLYAALTLDPLEFARSKASDRLKTLKAVVATSAGIDFAAIEKARQTAFDRRRDLNRDAKALAVRAAAIPAADGLPETPIDTAHLMTKLAGIGREVQAIEAARRDREGEARKIEAVREFAATSLIAASDVTAEIERLKARIVECREKVAAFERQAAEAAAEANVLADALDALPPLDTAPDGGAIQREIDDANRVNRSIEVERERLRLLKETAETEALSAEMDVQIQTADSVVRDAIAKANLPVRGLALGAYDVELDGVPFDQASDAQQLRASMAIAMSLKPALRVLRIRDGSLLDKDAMRIINEVCTADGWQAWIERLEPATSAAIHLEDGHIKA